MLDLKTPVITRHGNKVRIYECFNDYCIGSWLDESKDEWIPAKWSMPNGYFLKPIKGFDLVNGIYYEPETRET